MASDQLSNNGWKNKLTTPALAVLRDMYAKWPFFQALLSNMDMVLAKTNMAIASRYAQLVADEDLRTKRVQRASRPSASATISVLQRITGADRLLAANPLLERSIKKPLPLHRSTQPSSSRTCSKPTVRAVPKTRNYCAGCS